MPGFDSVSSSSVGAPTSGDTSPGAQDKELSPGVELTVQSPGSARTRGAPPAPANAAAAGAIAAKPLAHTQLEAHPILPPGQVRQGAPIVTMDASGWGGAQRTGGVGLRRLHTQGDLRRGDCRSRRVEQDSTNGVRRHAIVDGSCAIRNLGPHREGQRHSERHERQASLAIVQEQNRHR